MREYAHWNKDINHVKYFVVVVVAVIFRYIRELINWPSHSNPRVSLGVWRSTDVRQIAAHGIIMSFGKENDILHYRYAPIDQPSDTM